MDKNRLRAFATSARQELIQRVTDRAAIYGIDEKRCAAGALAPSESYQKIDGAPLTREEARQRDALLAAVAARGFAQAMEEAAYTWFNRLAALRYMQAHDLLPVRVSVLPDAPGRLPQIVAEAQHADVGLPPERVLALLEHSRTDALYKLQLIRLCNLLSESLPRVFEPIGDYTELLFPDGLLRPDSVLGMMSALSPDSWDDIETVGWLYQYYMSKRHEEVVDINGKAIEKDDVPAATCMYTPDWVVRYMVENSVGRLWLEGHPNEKLRERWAYCFDEAEQEPETAARLASIRRDAAALRPEEIAVLDPCMGSGHILVAAFDLLMDVYRAQGYIDRDAARLIVERNLYGLDIDERAAQLAYFAVMMKACEYDRRFLRRGVAPNVMPVAESDPRDEALLSRFGDLEDAARRVWEAFLDAKEYGSLLSVDATPQELDALEQRAGELAQVDDLLGHAAAGALLPLIRQAKLLAHRYDAVVTNPPYLNKFDAKLKRFIQEHYADYKADAFSAFVARNFDFCKPGGFSAFMSPFVWMFIKSYEPLRNMILHEKCITTLIQLEYSALEDAIVPLCTFVLRNVSVNYRGAYLRLSDFKGGMEVQRQKVLEARQNEADCKYLYHAAQGNFSKIPGAPVAYWVSEMLFKAFAETPSLNDFSPPKQGLITGDNERFLRLWYEVSEKKIALFNEERTKWKPINKGGEFRRWYGNQEYIVNWENNGNEILNFKDEKGNLRSRPQNLGFNFKESISWSLITSGGFSARYYPRNFMFNVAGICCFPDRNKNYLLGLLNSKITSIVTQILNPTINMNVGDVAKLPVIIDDIKKGTIIELVEICISLSRADWDTFETSWDFKRHPLI